ncbi:putative glycerol-3-phosphate 2-O-acyltransferase [Helianthus annuus]|nr:putative glycerol-3-phosphate 2-O-acyltransferase [Helianthus annuus]
MLNLNLISLYKMISPELQHIRKTFPLLSDHNTSTINHRSIAADLDGTLLKAKLSFPYYILIAIESGSLLRGLILITSLPIISFIYNFISESLAAKILIFITFCGVKYCDIEGASHALLPRFYAADVRRDSFEVFDRCERKVIVTANPVVMVETFAKEVLGAEKVIGTEIEVDVRTKRATGFVMEPGVMIGELKKVAVVMEFGEELPDIGLGDRRSDCEFMSVCKEGYMVPKDHFASLVSPQCLKNQLIFQDGCLERPSSYIIYYICLPFRFLLYPFRAYFNLSLIEGIARCAYRRM